MFRMIAVLCLASALGYAESWTGLLVNSKCYAALERNHGPNDTETYVDRDRNSEIRYCAPNAKTKLFAVVEDTGDQLDFDDAGNAKAADLVKNTGKKRYYPVVVTGEVTKNTVKVETISAAK